MKKMSIALLFVLLFVLASCSNNSILESTIPTLSKTNIFNMEVDAVPNGKDIYNNIFTNIKEDEVTIITSSNFRVNSSLQVEYYSSISETDDYLFVNWHSSLYGIAQDGIMQLLVFDGATTEYFHRPPRGSIYLPVVKDTYTSNIQDEMRKEYNNPLYSLNEYSFTLLNTRNTTEFEIVVPVSSLSTEEKTYVLNKIQLGFPDYDLDESKSIVYTIEIDNNNELSWIEVNYNLLLENYNTCSEDPCDIHEINEEIQFSINSTLGVEFITRGYIDYEAYKNGDLSQSIETNEVVDIFFEYDRDASYETYIMEIDETNSYIFNVPNDNQCLDYQVFNEDREEIIKDRNLPALNLSIQQSNVYLEKGFYLIMFENVYKCTGIGQTFSYTVDTVYPQDDYLDIYIEGLTPIYNNEETTTFNSNSAIDVDTIEFPDNVDYVSFTISDDIRVIPMNGKIEEKYSWNGDLYIIKRTRDEPLVLSLHNMTIGLYDIEFHTAQMTEDSFSFDSYFDLDIYKNQGERYVVYDTHNNATLYRFEITERTGLFIDTNQLNYIIYDYTYQIVGDSDIDLTTTLDVGIYYIKFVGFTEDYSVIRYTETVPDEMYYTVIEDNGVLLFEGLVSNEFDVDIFTFTVANKGVYKISSQGGYTSYLLISNDNPYLRIIKTTSEDFYIYLEAGEYEVVMSVLQPGRNFEFTFEYMGDSDEDSENIPTTEVNSNVTTYTYEIDFDYFNDPEQINIDITNAADITIDMPEGINCNIVFTNSSGSVSYNRYDSISISSENIYSLSTTGTLEMNLSQQPKYNSYEMYYGTATIIITVTTSESN